MKHKWKKVCAGALALTLFSTAILPHIGQKKVEAFSSSYGVCIDNHNFSSAGSWSKNDRYSNKMINMNDIEAQYGYKSPEYNQALQANIDTLHRTISTDDDVLLKMFWSGIVTFVSEGKSFANPNDLAGAQAWVNYAIQNYQDSVFHGYAPALAAYGFHPMTESELGTVVHGAAGQAIIDRDPLLKMLTNAHTLFPVGQYDPNRNYETDPLMKHSKLGMVERLYGQRIQQDMRFLVQLVLFPVMSRYHKLLLIWIVILTIIQSIL